MNEEEFSFKANAKVIFTENNTLANHIVKSKKGNSWNVTQLTFHLKTNVVKIELDQEKAKWLLDIISTYSIENPRRITLQQLKEQYEKAFEDFELFWFSKPIQVLKENGIILNF